MAYFIIESKHTDTGDDILDRWDLIKIGSENLAKVSKPFLIV